MMVTYNMMIHAEMWTTVLSTYIRAKSVGPAEGPRYPVIHSETFQKARCMLQAKNCKCSGLTNGRWGATLLICTIGAVGVSITAF
jgi:hypothetical protein